MRNLQKMVRIPHTLSFKVSVSFFLIGIIPLFFYLSVNDIIVSKHLNALEHRDIEFKVQQLKKIFQEELEKIEVEARDYAIWDEAFEKAGINDREWFQENVIDWLPQNSGIDLIIVSNRNGEIISQYGLTDEDISTIMNVENIHRLANMDHFNEKYSISGMKEYDGELYLLGAAPIIKNDYSGFPQGLMIFGKKVDSNFLDTVKDKFGYNAFMIFKGRFLSNSVLTKEKEEYFNIFSENIGQTVSQIDKTRIMASAPFNNISDETFGYIGIIQSRDMFLTYMEFVDKNTLWIIFLGSFLVLVLGLNLKKLIVQPIRKLETQITQMIRNSRLTYIKITGPEEVESLALHFNKLVDSINFHKKENEDLKAAANIDNLTGLFNRRYLYMTLKEKILEDRELSILFCHIDKFKVINDMYGHAAGDMVLQEASHIIKDAVERKGMAFRYGDEELVVLLEGCSSEEVYHMAEQVRVTFLHSKKFQNELLLFPVSVSIGIAAYPHNALNVSDLLEKADKAMYFAKHTGRNRCCFYNKDIGIFLKENTADLVKQEMLLNSAFALATAIDAKDIYTGKHSEYVTKYSLLLAEELQMPDQDKYVLRIGALLHDCGKIGVPDHIINKTSKLTDEEIRIIRNHTLLGHNIVQPLIKRSEIISCVRNHHERWDGNGYPDQLIGASIPIYARIVGVADAYHAMTSDRPYRKALSEQAAFMELRIHSGSQFDPDLIEPFIKAVKEDSKTIAKAIS